MSIFLYIYWKMSILRAVILTIGINELFLRLTLSFKLGSSPIIGNTFSKFKKSILVAS